MEVRNAVLRNAADADKCLVHIEIQKVIFCREAGERQFLDTQLPAGQDHGAVRDLHQLHCRPQGVGKHGKLPDVFHILNHGLHRGADP